MKKKKQPKKQEGGIRYVYLCHCVYRSPDFENRGRFANTAFETKQEAIDYCDHLKRDYEFWAWTKIMIGKFKKPRKVKGA